jgi:hypothetical protein
LTTATTTGTRVISTTRLDRTLTEEAWSLYRAAFAELDALAVQRHLMHQHEFIDVAADPQVMKYLCYGDGGTLIGVSTYTNDLDAVPLISPAYFERRWPDHYAERRIWYVGFVAVRNGAPLTAFGDLLAAMHHTSGRNALTVLDVCSRTEEVRHLPRAVKVLLHRLDGPVESERLDEQSYWMFRFTDGAGARL